MKSNLRNRLKWLFRRLPTVVSWLFMKVYELRAVFYYPQFFRDLIRFRRLPKSGQRFTFRYTDLLPMVGEVTATTGFDRHYIYHPAWAARVLARNRPALHVDISSSLHFCTLVSAFVPVDFYDYRPAPMTLTGLGCGHADLRCLPFADASITSLSCMHVVEHIGLGRYGDPLDYDGDLKAMAELKRVMAPGGLLIFVVPVGAPRLFFNAHRVYAFDQIVKQFSELQLEEFALIPRRHEGDLIVNPPKELTDGQDYGCGCFLFRKRTER